MNKDFNIEDHIKDLSPELQEKARACKTGHELLELIAENDVELSDEALEIVGGGFGWPCNSEIPTVKQFGSTPTAKVLEKPDNGSGVI